MVFIRSGNLKLAQYLERENRFVVYIKYDDRKLRCHLPNPGRMERLLIDRKTEVIFEPVPEGSQRKTDGTVIGIKQGMRVINLDTMLFSELLPKAISNNELQEFDNWKILEKEKNIGNHRFDFILEINGEKVITEVKSTTRVIDGVACFPDAVSKRATNHIQSLQQLSKQGNKTMVLFTVYQDAQAFRPCSQIDPEFSKTFYSIQNDVEVVIVQIKGRWRKDYSIEYRITGTIPLLPKNNR